jgi:F-type H+-transporting ATPase subunit delta
VIRRFARPYAKALSEIITSVEEARKVHEELTRFEKARGGSRELAGLFDHPGVDFKSKRSVIHAVGTKLKISAMGLRVLEVLAGNHRINQLGAILEAWKDLIHQAQGVTVAQVRVAHQLTEQETERLRKTLESKLGRQVELQLSMDPALLGGFVARIGSEVYDGSVTGRIEKFRTSLHQ